MADVLSQGQIDALLSGIHDGKVDINKKRETNEKTIKDYDFNLPKKFSRENLKAINNLHEHFSRVFSSYISGLLRCYCEINVISIEEQKYNEYSNSLGEYVLFGIIELLPTSENVNDTTMLFDMNTSLGFLLIDKLMGGTGLNFDVKRPFTEIEVAILKSILNNMIITLKDAWSNYIELDSRLLSVEINSRLLNLFMPSDAVVIISMEMSLLGVSGPLTICMSSLDLEQLISNFSDIYFSNKKKVANENAIIKSNIFDSIKKSNLEIKAILGEVNIDLKDIISLKENDIISLNKPIDSMVKVKVDDEIWFDAVVGCKRNKKAIKIKDIVK